MQVSVELVDPETAQLWLEDYNKQNRPLKTSAVDQLADIMLQGMFEENGESIIFAESGRLLDGQHRLQAIVKSGKTYSFVIVRGVKDKFFDTIDIGKTRSVGDILSILGQKGGNEIASVARTAMTFQRKLPNKAGFSQKDVAEYIYNNRYIIELTDQVKKSKGPLTLAPLAAVLFLANDSRQYDKLVEEFLSKVKTGEGLSRGSPILSLREWVIQEKTKTHSYISKEVMFEIISKVWTVWAENKTLSVIKPKTILGRPVEIYGYTTASETVSVAARTRPSLETPSAVAAS